MSIHTDQRWRDTLEEIEMWRQTTGTERAYWRHYALMGLKRERVAKWARRRAFAAYCKNKRKEAA